MWQTLTTLVEGGEATRSVVRRKASSRSKTVRPSAILGFLRSGRIATYNDVRKYDRCLTKLFNKIHSLTDEQYIVRFSKYGPNNIFLVALTPDSVNLHRIPDYSIYNYAIPNPCLEPISFMSIRGRTMLVVPCPRTGLNAVSIREFIHSSTRRERCMLWDKVFKTVKPGEYIYTHGYEVPWLHVKIRKNVKLYYSKNLLNIFSDLEKNNGAAR